MYLKLSNNCARTGDIYIDKTALNVLVKYALQSSSVTLTVLYFFGLILSAKKIHTCWVFVYNKKVAHNCSK